MFLSFEPASAHEVEIVKSDPAAGAVLEQPPDRVTIWFNEENQSGKSTFQVFNSDDQPVDLGGGGVDLTDPDHASMVVNLPALPDGAYLVRWKVVLLDGDESEGEYVFYVGAKPPLAGQPMSSGSSASADSPPNGKFTMWISVVIIALILVILVYLFRRARFRA
ncbi:MAG TPA: copper resistance CopC family protein [Anaerolineales bacterium]|nr:copper resistance CopC family protein [Anaerolineales bacterium]